MQENLVALLLADTAIAAKCGTRIYWLERPQGSIAPAIVLNIVSRRNRYTMSGPEAQKMTRVQADIFGATYGDTEMTARALVQKMDGFKGQQGTTEFAAVFLDGRRDQREAGTNDAERLFRVSIDLLIHHREI